MAIKTSGIITINVSIHFDYHGNCIRIKLGKLAIGSMIFTRHLSWPIFASDFDCLSMVF